MYSLLLLLQVIAKIDYSHLQTSDKYVYFLNRTFAVHLHEINIHSGYKYIVKVF